MKQRSTGRCYWMIANAKKVIVPLCTSLHKHAWLKLNLKQRLWRRISCQDYMFTTAWYVCDRCEGVKRSSYLQGGCCSRKFKRLTQFMRSGNLKFKYLNCESWRELKSEYVYMMIDESFLKCSFSGQMRTKVAWKLISDGWVLMVKRAKTFINYIIKILNRLKVD
jgi:hypothetical protein